MKQTKKLKIALVQFARSRSKPKLNLKNMLGILDCISGVDLVCLPEVWMGFAIHAQEELEDILAALAEKARAGGFGVLTGGLFVSSGARVLDLCHVIDSKGNPAAKVGKAFPSNAVGERMFMDPEAGSGLVSLPGLPPIGIAICVDAIYPERVRALALEGAMVVFNPANIPANRTLLWQNMTCARAAENTVFAAFVNNCHTRYPDKRAVKGGSCVAAPDGTMIISCGEDQEILKVELDLDLIRTQRLRWPYLEDIRRLNAANNAKKRK